MSHIHISDVTKPGSAILSDGKMTFTVSHQPHNLKVCVCDNCKAIKEKQAAAAKKAAEEKKKKNADRFIAHFYGCANHAKH